jgi:hypothetical protein
MSNAEYEVPDGMYLAAKNAARSSLRQGLVDTAIDVAVEAAIRWLAENPIVPSNEQADQLWHHPKTLSGDEHYAKAMARQWQQMMFLKRDTTPEDLKALLIKAEKFLIGVEFANDHIRQAYELGRKRKD